MHQACLAGRTTCSLAIGDSAALSAASAQARWQHPDFAVLPSLCQEARLLATRARLILRVALAYNTLGMLIAAAGMLHPVTATVLMLISSITVMALAACSPQRGVHPIIEHGNLA